MFVRKRKNKSGSISIQVIDKLRGNYKVVEHIGTTKSPSELEYFIELAKSKIYHLSNQYTLLEEKDILSWLSRFLINRTIWVGYLEVFGSIFDKLGYDKVLNEDLLKDIVIARIVHPHSKLSTQRWLERKFGRINVSKDSIYRFMDKLTKDVEKLVCDHTYQFFQKILNKKIHVIFFDATTLHFETFESDDFRKPGFSKVGKHNQPQVVVALMVTTEGLPIGYDAFPGNQFDGHTIRAALKRVSRRYDVNRVVFIADSAMMSDENIKLLEKSKFEFIMAARIKSMGRDYTNLILDHDNYEKNIFETEYGTQRLIVSYSPNRAKKDEKDREKNVEHIKKRLTGRTKITKTKVGKIGKSKYLEVLGNADVMINYQAVRADEKWDGLKGYVTNIRQEDLNAEGIIGKYTELWEVERAFRISKQDLRMRPIYHYKRKRIRAHILLVFMSLAVSRYTEYLLKDLSVTTNKLLENLENIQLIEIIDKSNDMKFGLRPQLNELSKKIYEKLGLEIKDGIQKLQFPR